MQARPYNPEWASWYASEGARLTATLTRLRADALAHRQQNVDFLPVRIVAEELSEAPVTWYISSNWTLDRFAGCISRFCHGVDVVIARGDQLALQRYLNERGWRFLASLAGKLEPWAANMSIALPRHQVHAHRDLPPEEMKFIDFLLSVIDDDRF